MAKKKNRIERVQVSKEVDGIEMGVLADGTPFLSMRSLSGFCGVSHKNLSVTSRAWLEGNYSATQLGRMLLEAGVETDKPLHHPVTLRGSTVFAFDARVSQLVLEYYAHHAAGENPVAVHSLRAMGFGGVGHFILHRLGIDPNSQAFKFRQFIDRASLVSSPPGYWSVFAEINTLVIHVIQAGVAVNDMTVPDISVGRAWGDLWVKKGFDQVYAQRIPFDHRYPSYFPQAASNPQEIWVYPMRALSEFRIWLESTYVVEQLPAYAAYKVGQGLFPAADAERLLQSYGGTLPKLKGKRKKKE